MYIILILLLTVIQSSANSVREWKKVRPYPYFCIDRMCMSPVSATTCLEDDVTAPQSTCLEDDLTAHKLVDLMQNNCQGIWFGSGANINQSNLCREEQHGILIHTLDRVDTANFRESKATIPYLTLMLLQHYRIHTLTMKGVVGCAMRLNAEEFRQSVQMEV